ncbi:MAG: universal stress protein [Acidobacteriota bacterium]
MDNFKSILLYEGGDAAPGPALDRGTSLAKANDARLTLVDVLPDSPWLLPSRSDLEGRLIDARRDDLEELAASAREHGIDVEVRVLTGRPFVELIREVHGRGHDLVMKTAQGSQDGREGLMGSTALHLFRKCPCPVWVVKPGEPTAGRVVAAIDPDPDDPAGDVLSRTVLELALSLARSRDSELEIIHAWRLVSESMLRSPRLNVPSEQIDALLDETRERAEAVVRGLVETVDLSTVRHRVTIAEGLPAGVISRATEAADIAVLGTLSRAGLAGVLIGNTAEQVLRRVDCSVLAVKPPGFKSPVT